MKKLLAIALVLLAQTTIGADRTRPKVSITSPTNGTTVGGTLTITCSATDNVKVATVSLALDGRTIGTDTGAPWSFTWDTRTAANGTHYLKATATDAAGNYQRSTQVMVRVNNAPNPPPPTCTWIAGAWSAWSTCVNGKQTSTRTLTSSVAGCTPGGTAPPMSKDTTCTVAPPPPPQGSITGSIAQGSTLSGSVKWSANNGPCIFTIDGVLPWQENLAPYDYNGTPDGAVNTTALTNGPHVFRVRMVDGSGDHSVTATVSNTGTPPPPPPVVCTWVTGTWSAWGTCTSGTQTRTRTVVSTISACTPADAKPAESETQTCTVAPPPPPPSGVVRYASPSGTGDGLTRSTPYSVSAFLGTAQPGWTLLMLAGHYTGNAGMITPPAGRHGTQAAPITVKAEVDGAVDIDGEGARKPCELLGNNWWVIEGVDMHNTGGTGIGNHVCNTVNSANVTFVRCVGWDAQWGTTNIFRDQNSSNVSYVDCAGFGIAIKVFSNSQGGNNTRRTRCLSIWDGSTQEGPKCCFSDAYNSTGTLDENCIAVFRGARMPESYALHDNGTPTGATYTNYQVQKFDALFAHADISAASADMRRLGCIGMYLNKFRGPNSYVFAGAYQGELAGIYMENCAALLQSNYASMQTVALPDATPPNTVKNCSFIGGTGTGIGGNVIQPGNYKAATLASGRNITSASVTSGAQIVNRYENGVLTNTPLWPWPMRQRIIDAHVKAGITPFDVDAEVFGVVAPPPPPPSGNVDQLAALGRQWLAATGSARTALEPQLKAQTSNIAQVIAKVRPNNYSAQPTGLVTYQGFTDPAVQAIFPNHQWHLYVPTNYDPTKPIGIIYSMHYGGAYSPGENEIQHVLEFDLSPETAGDSRSLLRPHTNGSNYILIAPIGPFYPAIPTSIPWASRWNVPLAERYFTEIVKQVNETYNIDFDRIAVCGFSMGAPGAVHLAQRLNDRLCAAAPFNPSMRVGSWSHLNDLAIYLVHGINDPITRVQFSDVINQCLDQGTSPHVYTRHNGGHEFETPEPQIKAFIDGQSGWLTTKIRDPYRKTVHARDKWRSYIGPLDPTDVPWDENPSPHTYWVSINATKPGTIDYDRAIDAGGTNITRGSIALQGASVDATISGSTITCTTKNVTSFSLWITPAMVGNASSVTIVVNGVPDMVTVAPNLLDALRSYERRKDWNMSYWQEIVVPVP